VKAFLRFAIMLVVGCLLTGFSSAGPVPMTESKEVMPVAPSPCNWSGFYFGINGGGEFGHSEDKDLNDYNFLDKPWGYSESGPVGGEQVGYNWQWGWLVLGPEVDAGYMDLNGKGIEPGIPQDTFGESDSDFYVTLRGRVGFALNCWLFYATGGGIGVNWQTSVIDTSRTVAGPDTINASKEEFNWGWTGGGGIERMFPMWGHRWSIKAEYLFFKLDSQTFSAITGNGFGPKGWRADNEGHIVRAGLNFHF
jgi:outer membrane immunogenic protein